MNFVYRAAAAVWMGATLAAVALPASAAMTCDEDTSGGHMAGHGGPPMDPTGCEAPSSKPFMEADAKMHKGMSMTYTDNVDVDFVQGMIPHHQGAIDIAKIVQQYGKDAEVKKLAGEIIAAQEEEIAWMRKWLAVPANALAAMPEHHDHGGEPPMPTTAAGKAFADATAKMHKDMAIKLTGDADVDFVRGMIPHHQGATDMAKVVQEHGKDAEVKKLAAEIIKAQEQEIAWMRDWLKKQGK